MHYAKTVKLDAPPRETDEAPCTPEQAVELARFCQGERFETIRALGTWQAAKLIAEAQRMEKQFYEEVQRTEEASLHRSKTNNSILAFTLGGLAGLFWPKK